MGFGYVFLGCLFTVNVTYHNFTDVFAVALMLLGLSTLAPYARGFRLAFKTGLPLLGVSLFGFFFAILDLFGVIAFPAWLSPSIATVSFVCKFFFFWLLFVGVDEVARETDIPKLRAHAMRSRFLTPIVCLMGLFLELGIFKTQTVFLKYYLLGYLLFGVIYALLNSKTIYECYILICFEGDEDMEKKPSRFSSRKRKGEGEEDPK